MSIINFICESNKKEELKTGVWEIIHKHYLNTVYPNSKVKYANEGKNVYAERLHELMKEELCIITDTEDGICVEFDSTEDAGFSIADNVYRTNMGYNDEGLTYLKPVFEEIIRAFPEVCFEADCECYDKWVSEEYHCSYDGEEFISEEDEE